MRAGMCVDIGVGVVEGGVGPVRARQGHVGISPVPGVERKIQGRSTPSEATFDPTVLATIVTVRPAL